jgi:hypothetical protein
MNHWSSLKCGVSATMTLGMGSIFCFSKDEEAQVEARGKPEDEGLEDHGEKLFFLGTLSDKNSAGPKNTE